MNDENKNVNYKFTVQGSSVTGWIPLSIPEIEMELPDVSDFTEAREVLSKIMSL
jgi:hypothetical protein